MWFQGRSRMQDKDCCHPQGLFWDRLKHSKSCTDWSGSTGESWPKHVQNCEDNISSSNTSKGFAPLGHEEVVFTPPRTAPKATEMSTNQGYSLAGALNFLTNKLFQKPLSALPPQSRHLFNSCVICTFTELVQACAISELKIEDLTFGHHLSQGVRDNF